MNKNHSLFQNMLFTSLAILIRHSFQSVYTFPLLMLLFIHTKILLLAYDIYIQAVLFKSINFFSFLPLMLFGRLASLKWVIACICNYFSVPFFQSTFSLAIWTKNHTSCVQANRHSEDRKAHQRRKNFIRHLCVNLLLFSLPLWYTEEMEEVYKSDKNRYEK